MLHITKFYQPDCVGCALLDRELELLQVDHLFTTPFVLHHVDITVEPNYKTKYAIKKVPFLLFEDIPEYAHGPNDEQIPFEHSPSPHNDSSTIIGALNGYQRKDTIISYIDAILSAKAIKNYDEKRGL